MASPSKESTITNLIMEHSPLKEWRFGEITREAKVTKAVANKWLGHMVRARILRKRKEPGKFPVFTAGSNNPHYHSLKKVTSLEDLHRSGLLPALLSVPRARIVILFGSYAKGDWYRDSDIDLFILGSLDDLDLTPFELKLGKPIEAHIFETIEEVRAVTTGLIRNVLNGYVIMGDLLELIQGLNASILTDKPEQKESLFGKYSDVPAFEREK